RVAGEAGEEARVARDELVKADREAPGDHDRKPRDHDRDERCDAIEVQPDDERNRKDQAEEGCQPVAPFDVVGLEGDWIGHGAPPLSRGCGQLRAPTGPAIALRSGSRRTLYRDASPTGGGVRALSIDSR